MSKIGFIGLGAMGRHMAQNLVNKGKKLMVFDTNPAATHTFKEQHAEVADSAADVAHHCKEIVTMLPNGSDVYSVFAQKRGILETLQPGSLCMDTSTIEPSLAEKVAKMVAQKQSSFVDAPVSGAEKATLTFMVGGDEVAFHRAKKIFELMGKNVLHYALVNDYVLNVGGIELINTELINKLLRLQVRIQCGTKVGNGLAAKICNNMLLGVQMVAVAEAINLGVQLGLDPKTLSNVINTSSGRCWATDTYNPVPNVIENTPACRDYEGGFRMTLMNKDMGLSQNASRDAKAPTPMGAAAYQLYQILSLTPEFKDKDVGAVYKFFQGQK